MGQGNSACLSMRQQLRMPGPLHALASPTCMHADAVMHAPGTRNVGRQRAGPNRAAATQQCAKIAALSEQLPEHLALWRPTHGQGAARPVRNRLNQERDAGRRRAGLSGQH
eukprot:303534-Chlamydomonas_euryale.AAC.1